VNIPFCPEKLENGSAIFLLIGLSD